MAATPSIKIFDAATQTWLFVASGGGDAVGGGGGGGLSQAEADSLYVNVTGDIIYGPLTVSGSFASQTAQVVQAPTLNADLTRKDYVDARTPVIVKGSTPPADTNAIWIDTN